MGEQQSDFHLSDTGGMQKPDRETADSVYSNFDHALDEEVATFLREHPDHCAQHAAWNFCGYVWYCPSDDGPWHDEVWVYGSPVEIRSGDDLSALIGEVNDEYGHD